LHYLKPAVTQDVRRMVGILWNEKMKKGGPIETGFIPADLAAFVSDEKGPSMKAFGAKFEPSRPPAELPDGFGEDEEMLAGVKMQANYIPTHTSVDYSKEGR